MNTVSDPAAGLTTDLVRFEVRDGIRRITCLVANEALEAVSDLPASSGSILRRRSFDRFRTLIHAAAMMRLEELPSGTAGPIVLTSRDLRRVAPEKGTPVFGSPARAPSKSVAAATPDPAPALPGSGA